MRVLLSILGGILLFIPGFTQDIVFKRVLYNPSSGNERIELENTTAGTIDVSTYWLCARFDYIRLDDSDISVLSGNLNMPGGSKLILEVSPSLGFSALDNTSSDLGLYVTNDFGDENDMIDFVQWGGSGIGRESVAVAACLWESGAFAATAGIGQALVFDGTNSGTGTGSCLGQNTITDVNDLSNVLNPLPIELRFFNAKIINGKEVKLSWETATESNNDFFTIERSVDGKIFNQLFIIPGAGNSVQTQHYEWIDSSPLTGISYYRLKQTDYDGQFSYSNIREIQIEGKTAIKIVPNPVSGNSFSFGIEGVKKPGLKLEIYNINGQKIYTYNNNFVTGTALIRIDLEDDLPFGMYLIRTKANGKIFTSRLIKTSQ